MSSASTTMNASVEPQRPNGVNPAKYIVELSEHNGVFCELCAEEQHTVPQLKLPVVRRNRRNSTYCKHTYTPNRGAYFYWNSDGTTFVRRVNGSASFTFAHGWVKRYGRGSFQPPDGVPFVSASVAGRRGEQRALCETYYEALFRRHHPRARWT